jgi:hypothetical protein
MLRQDVAGCEPQRRFRPARYPKNPGFLEGTVIAKQAAPLLADRRGIVSPAARVVPDDR